MGHEAKGMSEGPSLPLVVHVGFAGSRFLTEPALVGDERARFEAELVTQLAAEFDAVRAKLGLGPQHFLCGISQLAIGGDTVFSKVLAEKGLPHRVYLPQGRDAFLEAKGSRGLDFSPEDQAAAKRLFESPHVIEESVVAHGASRQERFEEVNLAIARDSDVVICLMRSGASTKPGGSGDLAEIARRLKKPLLLIEVAAERGHPTLTSRWERAEQFVKPSMPVGAWHDRSAATLPSLDEYASWLKAESGLPAKRLRNFFEAAAHIIVGTHLFATVFAVLAMSVHSTIALAALLCAELAFLAVGFFVHRSLHRRDTPRHWAIARAVREIAESAKCFRLHASLGQLFAVSYPVDFRLQGVIRTLDVLHLRSSRMVNADWVTQRDEYIEDRLVGRKRGQIVYYRRESERAKGRLKRLRFGFILCLGLAFLSTAIKLAVAVAAHDHAELALQVLGALAILLPTCAVAVLSIAAATDCAARESTFAEEITYLERTREQLASAKTARECAMLILEIETSLLGENANWSSRRAYTGIA